MPVGGRGVTTAPTSGAEATEAQIANMKRQESLTTQALAELGRAQPRAASIVDTNADLARAQAELAETVTALKTAQTQAANLIAQAHSEADQIVLDAMDKRSQLLAEINQLLREASKKEP